MNKKELQKRYFKLLLMCHISLDIIESQYEKIDNLEKLNKKLLTSLNRSNRVTLAKYNKLKMEKEELELRLFTIGSSKKCQ